MIKHMAMQYSNTIELPVFFTRVGMQYYTVLNCTPRTVRAWNSLTHSFNYASSFRQFKRLLPVTTESISKLSKFNFQWTKALYRKRLEHAFPCSAYDWFMLYLSTLFFRFHLIMKWKQTSFICFVKETGNWAVFLPFFVTFYSEFVSHFLSNISALWL